MGSAACCLKQERDFDEEAPRGKVYKNIEKEIEGQMKMRVRGEKLGYVFRKEMDETRLT